MQKKAQVSQLLKFVNLYHSHNELVGTCIWIVKAEVLEVVCNMVRGTTVNKPWLSGRLDDIVLGLGLG